MSNQEFTKMSIVPISHYKPYETDTCSWLAFNIYSIVFNAALCILLFSSVLERRVLMVSGTTMTALLSCILLL